MWFLWQTNFINIPSQSRCTLFSSLALNPEIKWCHVCGYIHTHVCWHSICTMFVVILHVPIFVVILHVPIFVDILQYWHFYKKMKYLQPYNRMYTVNKSNFFQKRKYNFNTGITYFLKIQVFKKFWIFWFLSSISIFIVRSYHGNFFKNISNIILHYIHLKIEIFLAFLVQYQPKVQLRISKWNVCSYWHKWHVLCHSNFHYYIS